MVLPLKLSGSTVVRMDGGPGGHSSLATLGTYTVPDGAQLVEGLDVKPGPLVPCLVQRHPHGVLLQQRRQPLVHRQVFVAFQMQELRTPGEHAGIQRAFESPVPPSHIKYGSNLPPTPELVVTLENHRSA